MIESDVLPAGWTWSTLGDVAKWGSGGTPKRTDPRYFGGDIPWAVIGDLNDGWVTATATYITNDGLRESAAKWIAPGAILLAMYGSIGKLGRAGIPMTTNQAIAHAIADDRVISQSYLFWYLRSARRALLREGKGGTQQNISQTVIKSFRIPLAPREAQDEIAGRIEQQWSRIDDAVGKLELNLKRASLFREGGFNRSSQRSLRASPMVSCSRGSCADVR